MVRQYKDLCKEFQCSAKVISKMTGTLKNRLGSPDLLVMFTDTISHKMVRSAMNEIKGQSPTIARSKSSSMAALRNILEAHTL
jgi:hypothetical protein